MARPRIENHHAEWLSLVETSGPFLTVPTLKRVLPDGLDTAPDALSSMRVAHNEYLDNPDLQQRWVRWVIDDVLELADATRAATDTDPSHRVPENGITVRPTLVVRDHTRDGNPPVLLVHTHPKDVSLDRPLPGDAWAASPIDRAAELARASTVPLALVTNGDRWTLVWARPGESTGTCTWRSDVWLEETLTLRAFVTFLGARRFFVLPEDDGLARLLEESAGKQQEVADQLGAQVRLAVELLIATLDRADRDRQGELLEDLESAEVYRGAVTTMMRLVFLFVAEERRLLPLDHPWYAESFAASTLRAQLQERADRYSENVLESSTAAWHRVLALFRAVHGGIEHDELRLPAYGGGLFDPDRYPFLEGRRAGTVWQDTGASPLPVDDRTMLHILDALQTLEQGGARVLLSYASLDVEQIGHVYEGLLDHTALRLTDTVLALDGKHEPEIALGDIESWAADTNAPPVERLAKETGKSAAAVYKALAADLDEERASRLRAACDNDDGLFARIEPYAGLLRDDLRGDPLVVPAGGLFVTQALDRRSSGTYYTPRSLAEEVVKHALDPVVYSPGPADTAERSQWQLKKPADLLDLKVADIAMGSGAFLVASCRYLAARLLGAWEELGDGEWTAFGKAPHDARDEPAIPADPGERQQLALRLVAERCLYGVDRNPMAVEMAKLSLWLITLARDRPFSFLDHALRAGDSLLGVTTLRQLHVAHANPSFVRQARLDIRVELIDEAVDRALRLRTQIEAFVVRDPADAIHKARLLDEADQAVADARLVGDLIIGAALSQEDDADPLRANVVPLIRALFGAAVEGEDRQRARHELRTTADRWLVERRQVIGDLDEISWSDRVPFHWALEYPEVRQRGGFDAIVGNPPFQGGKKITGALGVQYRDYLVEWLADGRKGSADLVAYFFLRAVQLLRREGTFGLIATNTIAQGDTREVGLDFLTERAECYRAISSEPWPGGASLEITTVWARVGTWAGDYTLDQTVVAGGITSSLVPKGRLEARPERLKRYGAAFIGYYVLGKGFVLTEGEAQAMLADDPRNQDVVRPYINGEDIMTRPDVSASRWVINFFDWPIEKAKTYRLPFERVEHLVLPERANHPRSTYRTKWWQFAETRPGMRRATAHLERVIVRALSGRHHAFAFVSTEVSIDQTAPILAYADYHHFGVLSSEIHRLWSVAQSSTLGGSPRYIVSDCFETFVQPPPAEAVVSAGSSLYERRSELMLERGEGLTKTYNRLHNANDDDSDVVSLRRLHMTLDQAVAEAYGWQDLDLAHDFFETRFGVRFTFPPAVQREVLDRLLELNQEAFNREVRNGLHDKKKSKNKQSQASPVLEGFDA